MANVNPMWNAILKWSMSQSDGLGDNEEIKPLSKEDQEWLSKVMNEMVVDQVKRIKIVTEVLKMPLDVEQLRGISDQLSQLEEYKVELKTETSDVDLINMLRQKKEEALDELDELVERIDNARDLHTVGGLVPLIQQLSSPFLSIQWRAAQALSTVVQNNPEPQVWAVQAGAVPALLAMLRWEQNMDVSGIPQDCADAKVDEKARVKTVTKGLLALSCLLRNNPSGEKQFVEMGGVTQVMSLLASLQGDKRCHSKLVSLLAHFWQSPAHRANATSAMPALVTHLQSPYITLRESALNALMTLVEDGAHAANLSAALRPELGLREHVTTRLSECRGFNDPDDIEMVQDEVEVLQQLSKILSSNM